MQVAQVLKNIVDTNLSIDIKGIALNSKLINSGYIFIAIDGTMTHGNEFIDDAIENGAKLILTNKTPNKDPNKTFKIPVIVVKDLENKLEILARNLYPQAKQQKIIAITGTNGKSSILDFVAKTLQKLGKKTLEIGTLTHNLTTPDIFSLYQELNDFNGDYTILEVSSHALVQQRVKGLEFIVAIWSNLTHDHLDYHQTMHGYLDAKLLICNQAKYGIFNVDDANYKHFANKLEHLSYSLDDLNYQVKECGFLVNLDDIIFELNLVGKFNLYNFLAAYKTLLYLGFNKLDIIKNLSTITPPPGRMQNIKDSNIFIDFAHTPDGLKNALVTLKQHLKLDITLVFGCGGNRDKTKRSLMGKVANDFADNIILTSDNPRDENPNEIIQDIKLGINKELQIILDRELAIKTAIKDKDNVVLIAGKGHEDYQIIDGEKFKFNDYDVVINNL